LSFEAELEQVLPADLPHRAAVVAKGGEHLVMIEDTNRNFNLTRITGSREAAIKHVLDSVIPWRLFADARHILDAGTGAGFPGIPLALTLPDVRFTLSESVQKKARFVDAAIEQLDIRNATVEPRRAEEILRDQRVDIITARALAPISRALGLFAPLLKPGMKLLLYKGPDAEQEIAEAAPDGRKRRVRMEVVMRYSLPDDQGSRTSVQVEKAA
jgi:16S rRNA (guanine527-N7)-methyltransferase